MGIRELIVAQCASARMILKAYHCV